MKELYIYTNEWDEQYNVSKEKISDVQTIDTILVPDQWVDLIFEETAETVQSILAYKVDELIEMRQSADYAVSKERWREEIEKLVTDHWVDKVIDIFLCTNNRVTSLLQANMDNLHEIQDRQDIENSLT